MELQMNRKRMSISDAAIEKPIQKASNKCTIRVPPARIQARNQHLTTNNQRMLQERAQLIYDKETGQYLKYRQLVSSRELRRSESDEEMHSCLPTLAESDFVETKAGSKSRLTSYKKPKYSEKGSVLGM